jgi:sigma-B regulation protein RsbU (phosphoserine phosphatase)
MNVVEEFPAQLVLDPARELERVQELRSLDLLDTPTEDRFDRITQLAADFFQVPIAYVAFIDNERQWFKSRVGLCPSETTRKDSFCQYTILRDGPLVMPDAREHPISRHHPMVVGEPFVRFYAGVPLTGPRGLKIGTFCLVDLKPREFGSDRVQQLSTFAAIVEREMNMGQIIQMQNELLSTRAKLVETQTALNREFTDAAKYVRRMLPPPLTGAEKLDWHFNPSTHLGGDGLGYRPIDDDRLAIYILDVTGHGLGSALLAVTALEFLRSRQVRETDFASPSQVIGRLNRAFQMKEHAGKFFSVWYGVYSRSARTITYGNAGHPPALFFDGSSASPQLMCTPPGGPVLGVLPEVQIPEITIPFPAGSELILFTDGLYELLDPKGGHGSYDEFFNHLQTDIGKGHSPWEAILDWSESARENNVVDDDVSLMRFTVPTP